jgi:hypothetical protein
MVPHENLLQFLSWVLPVGGKTEVMIHEWGTNVGVVSNPVAVNDCMEKWKTQKEQEEKGLFIARTRAP